MEEENQPKAKKRKVRDSNDECSEEETDMFCETAIKQPDLSLVKTGNYVIVAYQDQWYLGYVVKIDTDQKILKVKFMTPCHQKGLFMWPMRDDIQNVKPDFLLDVGIVPDCVNYGRQWSTRNGAAEADAYPHAECLT
ncbi:hypothetical protein DPMN_168571 [Dreissena polymorpha]|uniref:Tudor domain-containing protein n=1 Tax=Dreissena polymorpha TaxID=45954 RepID=A0A9D4IZR1_DREPO|nr:hypothetical protein DPMN_168571 [Dreissena polymorpha]